jgi:hypothetical protein
MTKNNEITIVDPSFPAALYEMEKLIKDGYRLSQQREPIYIAGLYEIVMELVEEDAPKGVVAFESDLMMNTAKRGPKPKVQK